MVVDVTEVVLFLLGESGQLGEAAHQASEGVALWRHGLAHPDELSLHLEDLLELLLVGLQKIASSSSSMRSSGSARLGKKLSTRPVDNAVKQQRWVVGRSLALPIAPPDLCKSRTVLAMNSDKEPFGVEAMHLDQPVVVAAGAVDDD